MWSLTLMDTHICSAKGDEAGLGRRVCCSECGRWRGCWVEAAGLGAAREFGWTEPPAPG